MKSEEANKETLCCGTHVHYEKNFIHYFLVNKNNYDDKGYVSSK